MVTLTLHFTTDDGEPRTFQTRDALWIGERWNGFPAPMLPKWQAYALDLLLGEDPGHVPHSSPDEDRTREAAYVSADGLTWTVEPETDGRTGG